MSCQNCGCQNTLCGCEDTPLTTPAPCNPVGCPDPYPCSEVTNAECVIYTGDDILCQQDIVVTQDTNIADALNQVVDYFCENAGGTNTVVAAGPGITVMPMTIGNTTTYIVSARCPMTVLIGNTNLAARSIQATVTGGTAPYTYVWEMADFSGDTGSLQSMLMLDATAFPQVVRPTLNPSYIGNFLDSDGVPNSARTGLAKVTVTDANGCIARDTLLVVFTPAL